jgi:hypothetical protein
MTNKNDFNVRGSLRSIVSFLFTGEINTVSVRRRQKYETRGEEKVKSDSYYLIIEDAYGWTCSLWRANMSQETAYALAAKIPYGRTIHIEGEVSVRKGNTFFNATFVKNPDGTNILLFSADDTDKKGEGKEETDNDVYFYDR